MLKDFREFVTRGNMIDLAVGVILGVAFGAVVTSLVNDIIMPPIGQILGGLDFRNLFVALDGQSYSSLEQARGAGAAVIAYGAFINSLVNFLIVAFSVFLMLKQVSRFRKPVAAPVTATKECVYCGRGIPIQAIRCPECTSDLKLAA
jgi:large conductance mechanosensitive channel